MPLAATVNPALSEVGQKTRIIRGTLALSGTYPTNGEAWDLTKFAGAPVKKNGAAVVSIWGASGYSYGYVPGADLTAGKVKTMSAAGTEHTAATYNAAVSGDTIYFEVVFPKL